MKSDISFKEFCKTYLGEDLQTWQSAAVDMLSEHKGRFILWGGRRQQHRAVKEAYREYLQSFCVHEWTENILMITPSHSNRVTACLKCHKVKDE